MAPAKTGKDKTNKKTVTNTVQTNILIWLTLIPVERKFRKVTIKFIPPSKDLTPAKCKLKIAKSTLKPG
jgi:hypothetical protein